MTAVANDFRNTAKLTGTNPGASNYLDSFPDIPKEFDQFEREELHYYHLLTLIKYESLHRRYTKQPDFTVSKDFLKELEEVDYVDEYYKAYLSVSTSTENKHDAWREMITEKELGGIQLIADNNWSSDFVKAYQINGIPRFILIDPEGNIISPNAPRPSNSELISLFNELGI